MINCLPKGMNYRTPLMNSNIDNDNNEQLSQCKVKLFYEMEFSYQREWVQEGWLIICIPICSCIMKTIYEKYLYDDSDENIWIYFIENEM